MIHFLVCIEGVYLAILLADFFDAVVSVVQWSHLIDKYNLASNQTDLAMIADVGSECRLN